MANKYKNTQTLNPALRSIGNMNVRGVVKGGISDADKKARYGLPVMVSETGYIDPSLLEGGSVGGGTTENRVVELINDKLQPYNNGVEIKADIDSKVSKIELSEEIKNQIQQNIEVKNEITNVIDDKLTPYNNGQEIKDEIDGKASKSELPDIIKNQLQQNTEIKNEISNVIKEQIQQGSEVKTEITNIVGDTLAPYANGQEIKDEVNEKVNTSDYDADFVVFDTQTGSTKGEKIKNYIDNITPPTPENVIEKTDMSPYGQTDKTQTGAEIENAIGEKVATTTYENDFATFAGEAGSTIGEKIRNAITSGTQGQGITEAKLSECLNPYSTSSADITEIGTKIKADTNSKVATDKFNSEFAVFDDQTGTTKGEKIKAYIDDHGGDPTAILQADMSPYGQGDKAQTGAEIQAAIASAGKTDEQIKDLAKQQITTEAQAGGVIDTAIDAKIGDNLLEKTDLAPYGQTDKTQIGAEIAAAIQSAGGGHTDERIKELAEEKIVADVAGGGTIDTAISNKLTTEKVLRQGDLAPYGATEISQTGSDIQTAINAVEAKTKTDQEIKELADGQIELNAVVPTDMGEFYTDDKTKIGENIKNAILAGGDPSNPSVKQSDLAPYGVADVTQAGADIQNGISTAISNAFAPYTNGQSISEEQAQQNSIFNKRINEVDDSIVPTIKDTFGYNGGFEVKDADIINSANYISNPLNLYAFIYVKGNNSYTFVDPKDGKLKRLKCDTDTIEEIAQLTYSTSASYRFMKCYSEPDFIICVFGGVSGTSGVNAFSRDGGQTWSVFTYQDSCISGNSTPFFFKDKNGNYYLRDCWSSPYSAWAPKNYRLQVDDLSASLYADSVDDPLNSTAYYLFNDNIILPNRDGNFYKTLGTHLVGNIYNGCYMRNITPQNWNDTGTEQFKNCYLRIVFADGRKENFDGAAGNWMHSMIKIGNKLLAFGAKYVGSASSYLAMAVCDDIHGNWDNPETPLEFHEVTAKDNKLNGKTLAAGFLNLSDQGGTYAKNGLSSYYCYNYGAYYHPANTMFAPVNDLPIIHIEADRYVYMIGMQNQNADYSGNPIPIGMKLDLEKHEVTDEPLKFATKNFPTESLPCVFPCCYQYNIGCYKKEGPFYQIIKNVYTDNSKANWYYVKISRKGTVVDSFQVGDILVSCRTMGESWLECDGSTFTAENYPLLAGIITDLTLPTGTPSFLTGGTTTFKVYIKAK